MTQFSQKYLRDKYNPEGSPIRNVQHTMLNILEVFIKICDKNNIPYWIEGGTLLGAVRHKGFIPWDDDLDIQVLKDDYKKLCKILIKELPNNLALQNHDTDKFFFKNFSRIRDLNSELIITNPIDHEFYKYKGVFIDIIPIEKIKYKFLSNLSTKIRYHFWFKWREIKIQNIKIKRLLFEIEFRLEHVLFNIFRICFIKTKTTPYRYAFGTDNGFHCLRSDIFPLKKLSFEGIEVNVPNNYKQVLTNYYGENYMELPSESQRNSIHSSGVRFNKN